MLKIKDNKYIKHFITITKHKWYVMRFCFKCGLYRRGILHDLSKYGLTEFFASAKYFQGTSSPIDAEKKENGYSIAWQHHKGHNPHHWEYWIDNLGTYKNTPCKIPYQYVVEMICDWLGAGIVYSKQRPNYAKGYDEPLKYYNKCKNERIFHKETQDLIEYFLNVIKEKGINEFCKQTRDLYIQIIAEYQDVYIP